MKFFNLLQISKRYLLINCIFNFQITQAKLETVAAKELAEDAHDLALLTRNRSENTIQESEILLDKVDLFLNAPGAKPAEIRKLASEVIFSLHTSYICVFIKNIFSLILNFLLLFIGSEEKHPVATSTDY
jgi:hypothetical protein